MWPIKSFHVFQKENTAKVQRTVGVLAASAVLFGNCVGAGIFISPKGNEYSQLFWGGSLANASGHCSELNKLFNSPKVPTNLPIRPTFASQNILPHLVLTTVIYAGVYEKAGSPGAGLVVWGLTGILATLCTLTYAELGVLDMTCDELFDNGDFLKAPNILS